MDLVSNNAVGAHAQCSAFLWGRMMSVESFIKNIDGLSQVYELANINDVVETGSFQSYMGVSCHTFDPAINGFKNVGSSIWPVAVVACNGGQSFVILKFKTISGEYRAAAVALSELNSHGEHREAFAVITHADGKARDLSGLARVIGLWLDFGEPTVFTYDVPQRSMKKPRTIDFGVDKFL